MDTFVLILLIFVVLYLAIKGTLSPSKSHLTRPV